jgi:SAM-dependent methyltransferase
MIQEALWMLQYCRQSIDKQFRQGRRDLAAWRRFWRSYEEYKHLASSDRQPALRYLLPCLGDDTAETVIEPLYFYQDAWAFNNIVKKCPQIHLDVGSHHRFVSLLSKVVPVIMVDIRPLSLRLHSLTFRKGSILNLPFEDRSLPSVSSLCCVEHIGLGRYGDILDPYGTEKAIEELKRVVAPGGDLYISLPLDDENRTYFNAHRAFREEYVLSLFKPFDVIESRYVYGQNYCERPGRGFGTGCYSLRSVR